MEGLYVWSSSERWAASVCWRVALVLMNDECCAGEAEVEVSRPACSDASFGHDVEAKRINQGEILVAKAADDVGGVGQAPRGRRQHAKRLQLFNERQELQGACLIEASEKPTVSFCDNECGGDELWRVRKESTEEEVKGVGLVQNEIKADVST